MPKVSIIIPTYNSETYLKRCLDSLVNQTFSDFEVLIYDGGSSDNTHEIIKTYDVNKCNIKLFIEKDSGPALARTNGIKNSSGEYIMFIDSDDFVDSDYIETYLNGIENTNEDVVIGGYKIYKGDNVIGIKKFDDNEFSKYFSVGPWGRIIKRSFLVNNNLCFPDINMREDVFFNFKIYNSTIKIKIIDYAGYYYYVSNENSMTKTIHKSFNSNFFKWLDLVQSIEPINIDNKYMIEYCIIQSSICYLLYSGKGETYKSFMNEYKKIFSWLNNNIPDYKKNRYLNLRNKYDSFLYKIAVCGFIFIDRLHLVPLFARIRCFGN